MPAPTLPPVPGGYTTYNPKPGDDPEWDAYVATYTNKLRRAAAEAEFAKSKLQDQYRQSISNIDYQAPEQRTNLEASLLSRGVGRSGEALRRAADLESGIAQQKSTAERALTEGTAGIAQSVQNTEYDLAAEREAQIAASRERLAKRGKTPEVTTPGYTPPPKKKPAKPVKQPTPQPRTNTTTTTVPAPPRQGMV